MPHRTRRAFLRDALAGAALAVGGAELAGQEEAEMPEPDYPAAVPVTKGPKFHYFGYYDKTVWDASGRYVLANEVSFMDRQPNADDVLTVGLVDLQAGNQFRPLAETRAWNWQQGTMLQWVESAPERLIVHNHREEDRFVAIVRDIETGQSRTLPRPVCALSRDGRYAVSLNYARIHQARPGYGYLGLPDPWQDQGAPDDDGIYWMDMATGEDRLIISHAQVAAIRHEEGMEDTKHWFNHLVWSPDGSRFAFLHRWRPQGGRGWKTRLFTANPDGSDIYCLADHDMVSHYDWCGSDKVLAWARQRGIGDRYFLFTDRTDQVEVVGEGVLTTDGHCSYSPDGRWILTDTYPDREHRRTLILFRPADGRRVDLGRFYSPPELGGPIRCDLHPRWNRDGTQVCIDSAHEGERQMYVLDVSGILHG